MSGVGLSAYVPLFTWCIELRLTVKIVYGKKRKRSLVRKKIVVLDSDSCLLSFFLFHILGGSRTVFSWENLCGAWVLQSRTSTCHDK